MLADEQRGFINKAVANRQNILITGGTGNHKTSLLKTIIAEARKQAPEERMVLLTDTEETSDRIQDDNTYIIHLDHSEYRTGFDYSLNMAERMASRRIFADELRVGVNPTNLLNAWNWINGGAATIHGSSPEYALFRLQCLCGGEGEDEFNDDNEQQQIKEMIAEAVNIVVFIEDGICHIYQLQGLSEAGEFNLIKR